MTSKHHEPGMVKGFYVTSEAWYADTSLRQANYVDEVTIGFYDEDEGGTTGEFMIRWYQLSGRPNTPKLEVFNDAFEALMEMPELLAWLREMDDINFTRGDLVEMLLAKGYKDRTTRTSPYKTREELELIFNPEIGRFVLKAKPDVFVSHDQIIRQERDPGSPFFRFFLNE